MALFSSLFIFNFFGVDLIALETAQPILKIDSLDQLRRNGKYYFNCEK